MKQVVYSIYDTAAGAYARPFFCTSDAEAQRGFSDITMDAEHPVGKHPEDYSLVRIGRYDDSNGRLDAENVECIVTGLAVVAQSRNINHDNLDLFDKSINGEDQHETT